MKVLSLPFSLFPSIPSSPVIVLGVWAVLRRLDENDITLRSRAHRRYSVSVGLFSVFGLWQCALSEKLQKDESVDNAFVWIRMNYFFAAMKIS